MLILIIKYNGLLSRRNDSASGRLVFWITKIEMKLKRYMHIVDFAALTAVGAGPKIGIRHVPVWITDSRENLSELFRWWRPLLMSIFWLAPCNSATDIDASRCTEEYMINIHIFRTQFFLTLCQVCQHGDAFQASRLWCPLLGFGNCEIRELRRGKSCSSRIKSGREGESGNQRQDKHGEESDYFHSLFSASCICEWSRFS